jgi:RiboL-PSP-HEPN
MRKTVSTKPGSVPKKAGRAPLATATKGPTTATVTVVQRLTPHDIFLRCIQRARNLIKIHRAAHGNQARPEIYLSDAHRASVVLAVSALDAYMRSFLIHKIREVTAGEKPLPPMLAAEIKRFMKDDQLLEAARKSDLLDRVEKAFRSDFEKRSFQGVRNISDAMKLVGFEEIFHTIARSGSVNEEELTEAVEEFTQRRHVIGHAGDYDLRQNPPAENGIKKPYAEKCIKMMTLVAGEIHKLE